MKTFKLTLLGGGALLLFSACVDPSLGRFTMLSTANVSFPVDSKKSKIVEGESCVRRILFFSWGTKVDRFSSAVDAALNKAQKQGIEGDLLSDAQLKLRHRNYWIYEKDCIVATGKVVSFKKK